MKTAVLGLGIIGQVWARNLHQDGIVITCWNRTKKEELGFCETPQEAIQGAEIIFVVVSDVPAVNGVIHSILPFLRPNQIVLQSSTITPQAVKALAELVRAQGADLLDLPFTGSKPAAEQRQTVFFAGGEAQTLAKVRPILQLLAKAILPTGPVGSASAIKLAMNLNIAQVAQALCESLQCARSAGISDELYFQALDLNVSKSGLADLKEGKLRNKDYAPQFSLKHMLKDLRQVQSMTPVPLPQLERVIAVYEQGERLGWGEDDFIGLMRLLSSRATD